MLKNRRNSFFIALATIIVFYSLLYILSIIVNAATKHIFLGGLLFLLALDYVVIPVFSIVSMIIYSIKSSRMLYQFGVSVFNSIACAALLCMVYIKFSVLTLSLMDWISFLKYPGSMLVLGIVISLVAFAIKKHKRGKQP